MASHNMMRTTRGYSADHNIQMNIRLTLGGTFPELLLVKVFLLLPKVPGVDTHCPYT